MLPYRFYNLHAPCYMSFRNKFLKVIVSIIMYWTMTMTWILKKSVCALLKLTSIVHNKNRKCVKFFFFVCKKSGFLLWSAASGLKHPSKTLP
jgi:hypothetical protein